MEPVIVSIGSEPLQRVPAAVLKHSIIRRTERPVRFVESWTPAGWHELRGPRCGGTEFSNWRWLTPQLGFAKAIYLDADQVVLADISALWDALPEGKTIAAVVNAVGIFGKKTPEPGKVQTSVMVIDCDALRERARTALQACHHGRMPYRDLMQATWLPREEVAELPPEWNHFGIRTTATKLIHWSHVASQPYRNPDHPSAEVWWSELRDAVEREAVTFAEVQAEVEAGHLSPLWVKRLRKYAA